MAKHSLQPPETGQSLFRLANRRPVGVVSRSGGGREGALPRGGVDGATPGARSGVGKRPGSSMTNRLGTAGVRPGRRPRRGRGGLKSGVRVAHGGGGAGRVPGETDRPGGTPAGRSGARAEEVGCAARRSVASCPRAPRAGLWRAVGHVALEAAEGAAGAVARADARRKPAGRPARLRAEAMGAAPRPLAFRRSFSFPQMASASTSCPSGPPARGRPLPQSRGCRRGQGKS